MEEIKKNLEAKKRRGNWVGPRLAGFAAFAVVAAAAVALGCQRLVAVGADATASLAVVAAADAAVALGAISLVPVCDDDETLFNALRRVGENQVEHLLNVWQKQMANISERQGLGDGFGYGLGDRSGHDGVGGGLGDGLRHGTKQLLDQRVEHQVRVGLLANDGFTPGLYICVGLGVGRGG